MRSSEAKDELNVCLRSIETDNETITRYVDKIVDAHCKDLDIQMLKIKEVLNDTSNPINRADLEHIVLHMPSLLYWAAQGQEITSLKTELATITQEEKLQEAFEGMSEGRVGERKIAAKQQVMSDTLVQLIYNSAFKKIKAKINFATEMLMSAKKILSSIQEFNEGSYKPTTNGRRTTGGKTTRRSF